MKEKKEKKTKEPKVKTPKSKKKRVLYASLVSLLVIVPLIVFLVMHFTPPPALDIPYNCIEQTFNIDDRDSTYSKFIRNSYILETKIHQYSTDETLKSNILTANKIIASANAMQDFYLQDVLFVERKNGYNEIAKTISSNFEKLNNEIASCNLYLESLDLENSNVDYWVTLDGEEYFKLYLNYLNALCNSYSSLGELYTNCLREGFYVNPLSKLYATYSSEWFKYSAAILNDYTNPAFSKETAYNNAVSLSKFVFNIRDNSYINHFYKNSQIREKTALIEKASNLKYESVKLLPVEIIKLLNKKETVLASFEGDDKTIALAAFGFIGGAL